MRITKTGNGRNVKSSGARISCLGNLSWEGGFLRAGDPGTQGVSVFQQKLSGNYSPTLLKTEKAF
jgi:hypothetical protein